MRLNNIPRYWNIGMRLITSVRIYRKRCRSYARRSTIYPTSGRIRDRNLACRLLIDRDSAYEIINNAQRVISHPERTLALIAALAAGHNEGAINYLSGPSRSNEAIKTDRAVPVSSSYNPRYSFSRGCYSSTRRRGTT